MLKLIGLFSLLILTALTFGQPLSESISLKVKVIGRVLEEKPKLLPPDRIELKPSLSYLDLSGRLLEPPLRIEEAKIEVPGEGGGCGGPKDRSYYRAGVKYYLKGELKKAESKMLDVLTVQSSAFSPMAEYVLGLIYSKEGKLESAEKFLRSSCNAQHQYKQASCEAFYGVSFKLRGEPVNAESPELWRVVYEIRTSGKVKSPSCEGVVFKDYCSYVESFAIGKIDEDYRDSTELRRAVVLLKEDRLVEAEEIFRRHLSPTDRYRSVALYYMGVIAYKKGKEREAYRYASLLETIEEELAKNLFLLISGKNPLLSRIAYEVTGSKEALRVSGIHSYNRGRYKIAYAELTKAGEHMLAALSAIREGDYKRAYLSLRNVSSKDRDYYLWLLETLYWLGKDKEMEEVLKDIESSYPDLYREYMGWLSFRKGDWLNAYRLFKDPYHRAIALFNAGRYEEVLKTLKDTKSLKERLLKAKAAISLGRGKLARKFLTEESPEEIYLLGMSYFIEGNYEEAIRYFKRLLKEEALKSKAMLRIADSYYNLGNYDSARTLYKEILNLYPDSPEATDATLALAQIELQKPSGDLERLIVEFESKFPGSPMIPDLKYQLASLYLKEGKKESAKRILEELLDLETYKPRAMLKLAEIEEDPLRKEEMLKEVIRIGGKEEKKRATAMLMSLYLEKKEFEKLADFLSKGDYDDRKKALDIYINENLEKAMKLFDELIKENPDDEELKVKALELYSKTKGKKYLLIAKESSDKKVKAKALYLLGLKEKKRNKRKALEYFVEVILSAEKVQPYYNKSILQAVDLLLSMKARRDASCLLSKLDRRYLTKREMKKVNILRKKLPKCEVKK